MGLVIFFVDRELTFLRAQEKLKEGGGDDKCRGKKRKRAQMKEDGAKISKGKQKINDQKEKERDEEDKFLRDNIFKMYFDHDARKRWMDSLKEGSKLDARLETGFFHKAVVKKRIDDAIYVHYDELEDEVDRWIYLYDNKHSSKVAPLGTYVGKSQLSDNITNHFENFDKIDVYLGT